MWPKITPDDCSRRICLKKQIWGKKNKGLEGTLWVKVSTKCLRAPLVTEVLSKNIPHDESPWFDRDSCGYWTCILPGSVTRVILTNDSLPDQRPMRETSPLFLKLPEPVIMDMTYGQIVQVHRQRSIQQNLDMQRGVQKVLLKGLHSVLRGFYMGVENTLTPCHEICDKILPKDPVAWSRDRYQNSDTTTWYMRSSVEFSSLYLFIYLAEIGTWNLEIYLSLRVWIWYLHKNNDFV